MGKGDGRPGRAKRPSKAERMEADLNRLRSAISFSDMWRRRTHVAPKEKRSPAGVRLLAAAVTSAVAKMGGSGELAAATELPRSGINQWRGGENLEYHRIRVRVWFALIELYQAKGYELAELTDWKKLYKVDDFDVRIHTPDPNQITF